ncbi:MAG: hypothetical protein V1851_00945 [Patescibacteria group bacterium]
MSLETSFTRGEIDDPFSKDIKIYYNGKEVSLQEVVEVCNKLLKRLPKKIVEKEFSDL